MNNTQLDFTYLERKTCAASNLEHNPLNDVMETSAAKATCKLNPRTRFRPSRY